MAVLLVFSIVSLAVFFQSKPLTRFARSLIQGSRPPTATFEHFTGEGVMVTVALASAMIDILFLCNVSFANINVSVAPNPRTFRSFIIWHSVACPLTTVCIPEIIIN